jgi:hypothetical protein
MDWLSSEELRRKQVQLAEQQRREQSERESQRQRDYQECSYQANKARIDQIYDEIEAYIKRAATMGYIVVPDRSGSTLTITEKNPTPKGYTWVYIRPDGNKLSASFMNYGHHERRYKLKNINQAMIGAWIKWVLDRGLNGPPPG